MAVELPNPFDENEDTVRERFYASLDALFPNPATRPDLREASLLDSILAPVVAEFARLYDGLNYTLRKAFVQTADGLYLDNKGAEIGVARNAASVGSGMLRFYGDEGAVIPHATTVSTTTEDPDAPTYSFDTDTTVGGIEVPVADRTIHATPDPAARNEVQTISSSHTSGNFRLTYAGTEGSAGTQLPHNPTSAQVNTHLQTIPALAGKVTVGGGSLPATPITVEFIGSLAATDVSSLSITTSTLAGGSATVSTTTIGTDAVPTLAVVPLNETQTLAKTGTVTSGTYKLTYAGDETAAINYNDSAATIQTRLEALASIGTGNVAVTDGPLPGNSVIIEFKNSLGRTDLALITVTSSTLAGGGSYGITQTQAGAAGNGTNVVGNVKYKYTYVTRVGDVSDEAYDEGFGETAGSPVSVTKALADQSVIVTIPPVARHTGLNEVKYVNLYRALDDGGGFGDYRLLPGTIVADDDLPMTYTDNLDLVNFESIETVIPEENVTGVVDVSATATEPGAGTNAVSNSITLMEDLVDGVTQVTNREAFTGGSDQETDDSYRERLQDELTKSPGAGNLEDYRGWAREVDGIENVSVVGEWETVYLVPANQGPGSVKVIVSDANNSAVTLAKREEVRQYIAGDIAVPSPYEYGAAKATEVSTPGGASGLAAGTYSYVYTWVNVGGGETPHNALNSATGLVDETKVTNVVVALNDTINLDSIAAGPSGPGPEATVRRRVYRRAPAGGDFLYVGEIANNTTTTFSDTGIVGGTAGSRIAPVTNSTSKYNGKSPIGAHVTVDTIQEVTVTVSATIVPEVGYNLAGTGGNISLTSLLNASLETAIRNVVAGDTLYLSDVTNAIHDTEGVKDFRSVTLSWPSGCEDPTTNNGNVVPTSNNVKIVFSSAGVVTEAAA